MNGLLQWIKQKAKRLQQLAPWQQQPCALLLPGSSSAVPLQLPELMCQIAAIVVIEGGEGLMGRAEVEQERVWAH